MEKLRLVWGDLHKHVHVNDMDRLDELAEDAKKNLDFYAFLCYPFVWYLQSRSGKIRWLGHPVNLHSVFSEVNKDGCLLVESVAPAQEIKRWEAKLRQAAKEHNKEEEFVTLLGYEWHGNRKKYGDHNIIFFDIDLPFEDESELPILYKKLKGKRVLVIPHHTAYKIRRRGKDWNIWDSKLSPVAEIYSSHGASEVDSFPMFLNNNYSMGPGCSKGSWQLALNKGLRVGVIASNDGWGLPGSWNKGLAGVWVTSFTREGLWDAFQHRRTYAVTGDRIELMFWVNDTFMGGVLNTNVRPLIVRYKVSCLDKLDRVELIHNGRRVACHYYADTQREEALIGEVVCNIRIDFGWGPAKHYGFSDGTTIWDGCLEVKKGELLSALGCFGRRGQRLKTSGNLANWQIRLPYRNGDRESEIKESIIFTVKGTSETVLKFSGEGYDFSKKLRDLLYKSEVIALEDKTSKLIESEFGIRQDKIINDEVYYFNAPKIKLHRAVISSELKAEGFFEISHLGAGFNYLYIRVFQLNGQMAWSSPVWIKVKGDEND